MVNGKLKNNRPPPKNLRDSRKREIYFLCFRGPPTSGKRSKRKSNVSAHRKKCFKCNSNVSALRKKRSKRKSNVSAHRKKCSKRKSNVSAHRKNIPNAKVTFPRIGIIYNIFLSIKINFFIV